MFGVSRLVQVTWKPLASSVRRYCYPKTFYDMVKLYPEPNSTAMENGLRVVSVERPGSEHMCIGLFIDGGSRYESWHENGMAHFFEHIAFKGTRTRSPECMQAIMAETGARFRCFTTRELVGFYVECLSEDIRIIVDLLADSVFNNGYHFKEVELQKEIVYQEMVEQDTNPQAILFDYLHAAAFCGTPLEQTVMGKSSGIHNFCEQNIRTYIDKFFHPHRTVLAAAGGVCHPQLVDLAQEFLLKLEASKCFDEVYRFTACDFRFRDDAMPYAHTALAFEAPGFCDERAYVMDVASHLIGGWEDDQPGGHLPASIIARACSSGLGPGYRSFYIKYKDSGLWGVQFLCDRMEADMMYYNVQNELRNMCVMITDNEVDRARRAAKVALMRRVEGATGLCMDLGRWFLYAGRWPTLHEQLCELDLVSTEEFHIQCDYFLYDKSPCVAAVGAIESVPHYNNIRAAQYWVRY